MNARKPDMDRMLDLYRDATAPSVDARERVWDAIEADVAAPASGDAGASSGQASASAAAGSGKLLWLGGALLVAGATLLWTATRPAPTAPPAAVAATIPEVPGTSPARSPEDRAPVVAAADGAGAGAAPGLGAVRVDDADDADGADRAAPAAPAGPQSNPQPDSLGAAAETVAGREEASRPVSRKAGGSGATLAAEMKLMTAAQRAMRAGEHARALSSLMSHRARFPRGVMAEEREAERVAALCGLGRVAQADRVAKRFLTRFTGSPLAARVRRGCQEAPP